MMASDDTTKKGGVACPRCGNRLRVRPDQQGEQVRCPKCNATFTIGRSAPPAKTPQGKTRATTTTRPDVAYKLQVPVERPKIVHEAPSRLEGAAPAPPPAPEPGIEPNNGPMSEYEPRYDVDWETSEFESEAQQQPPPPPVAEDYLKLARERGLVRTPDDRPIPRWTFFSGVFTFPWKLSNIARWVTMAIALSVAGVFLMFSIGLSAGGIAMLGGPLVITFAAAMILVTLSFCSACFVAAVDDTADGNDDVQEITFPPLDQWLFSFASVLGIWLMSGALGYPLIMVPQIGAMAVIVSGVVLFPILFLSAMECESFVLPLSPNVWKTLVRYPGMWLAFYLISTAMLAGWLGMALVMLESVPAILILVGGPTLAAVMLIYARLLGRLAWRVTFDASPRAPGRVPAGPRPSASEPDPPAQRKKVRKLKLNLPDDLDPAAGDLREREAPPRKRIDFHKRG